MAKTYLHQFYYRLRQRYCRYNGYTYVYRMGLLNPQENFRNDDTMNRLLGNYDLFRYQHEKPKHRTLYDPHFDYPIYVQQQRKKWIKKRYHKQHRHAWKQALRDVNYELKIEKLPIRPTRYLWDIW